MWGKRVLLGVIGAAILFLGQVPGVRPDIYGYKDENGVWHFTNVNTDSRYRIYMRTSGLTPKQYIHKYSKVITRASRRFGVDPHLIRAVIKAESDFDSVAVSNKGAQGLMQLMPGTADDMEVEDPFSAEENILGGARYLALLLKRFNNNKKLALAAYNAGPEKVQLYKGIPPFEETRSFVKRVLAFYEQYSSGAR